MLDICQAIYLIHFHIHYKQIQFYFLPFSLLDVFYFTKNILIPPFFLCLYCFLFFLIYNKKSIAYFFSLRYTFILIHKKFTITYITKFTTDISGSNIYNMKWILNWIDQEWGGVPEYLRQIGVQSETIQKIKSKFVENLYM